MIGASQAVEIALDVAAKTGGADETIVLVTDVADASLRWAGNSMTTNGVSISRTTAVISIVRQGDKAHVGSVQTSDVDPAYIPILVAASQATARSAPEARDSYPLLTGTDVPSDWDEPTPGTGAEAFGSVAAALARGFTGPDQLYGFAHHIVETTWLATSTGVRRRFTQPTGTLEINAKRNGASAWAGVSTPWFVEAPTDQLLEDLDRRLGWASRTVELPAGRYDTILPPSAVADLMIYLGWSMDGRGAQEGRTALSAPGGGTRVGERLTDLPLTLYSDPVQPGQECAPFVYTDSSSERISVFDNGLVVPRVDWIRDGVINSLAYPRAVAAEFDAPVAVPASNLLMTGGSAEMADLVASVERGLLLTTLWYIREVEPTTLLLTGLTRDGVYLIEDGQVTAAVNNFRFNESPVDLLGRLAEVGLHERTLAREFGDYFTRTSMPAWRVADFNMSSVSRAS
jgi:predicted Zn-dependent protease